MGLKSILLSEAAAKTGSSKPTVKKPVDLGIHFSASNSLLVRVMNVHATLTLLNKVAVSAQVKKLVTYVKAHNIDLAHMEGARDKKFDDDRLEYVGHLNNSMHSLTTMFVSGGRYNASLASKAIFDMYYAILVTANGAVPTIMKDLQTFRKNLFDASKDTSVISQHLFRLFRQIETFIIAKGTESIIYDALTDDKIAQEDKKVIEKLIKVCEISTPTSDEELASIKETFGTSDDVRDAIHNTLNSHPGMTAVSNTITEKTTILTAPNAINTVIGNTQSALLQLELPHDVIIGISDKLKETATSIKNDIQLNIPNVTPESLEKTTSLLMDHVSDTIITASQTNANLAKSIHFKMVMKGKTIQLLTIHDTAGKEAADNTFLDLSDEEYNECGGSEAFKMRRDIILDKDGNPSVVKNAYLEFNSAYKNGIEDSAKPGFVKELLTKHIAAYKAAGVTYIKTQANVKIGGYTWLRVYTPDDIFYITKYVAAIMTEMPTLIKSDMNLYKNMHKKDLTPDELLQWVRGIVTEGVWKQQISPLEDAKIEATAKQLVATTLRRNTKVQSTINNSAPEWVKGELANIAKRTMIPTFTQTQLDDMFNNLTADNVSLYFGKNPRTIGMVSGDFLERVLDSRNAQTDSDEYSIKSAPEAVNHSNDVKWAATNTKATSVWNDPFAKLMEKVYADISQKLTKDKSILVKKLGDPTFAYEDDTFKLPYRALFRMATLPSLAHHVDDKIEKSAKKYLNEQPKNDLNWDGTIDLTDDRTMDNVKGYLSKK